MSEQPKHSVNPNAEELASATYKPHRFGDSAAWFRASVDLADRVLTAEADLALTRQQLHEHAETIAKLRADLDESIRANEINASSFKAECPVDVWVESCGTRHIAMRIMCKRLADAIAQRDAADEARSHYATLYAGTKDALMRVAKERDELRARVQKGEKGVNR